MHTQSCGSLAFELRLEHATSVSPSHSKMPRHPPAVHILLLWLWQPNDPPRGAGAASGPVHALWLSFDTSRVVNMGYMFNYALSFDVPINFDRWTRAGLIDTQGMVFQNQIGVLNQAGAAGIGVRLNPAFTSGLIGQTMYHCAVTRNPYDFVSNVITLQILP